ncbi:hypothetical protein K2173_006612 [Erythroxylum novogranatense]|uniref:Prolamin-like domain-containing protein n=1 Tax=Erythroxylum novogranatense TaxID=1862640 RepID=A0AAV8T5G5_9ROSI|nr:hypothetical protein K2173_006612 [Erythroxylum novogranatense]
MAFDFSLKLCLMVAFLACSLDYTAKARPLGSTSTLISRLKLDEQSPSCWDSLLQLQACTGEIILFFINGETHIGQKCCEAIRTIGEHCWPELMDALGFTVEEGNMLEGYCTSTASDAPPSPTVVPVNLVP